jgi:hypothetical protein
LASKPVDNPPEDRMRMPAVSQGRRLCTSRAHAKEQAWQPIQRSILGVVNIFMGAPWIGFDDEIQIDRITPNDRALIIVCSSVSRMYLCVNTETLWPGQDGIRMSRQDANLMNTVLLQVTRGRKCLTVQDHC